MIDYIYTFQGFSFHFSPSLEVRWLKTVPMAVLGIYFHNRF